MLSDLWDEIKQNIKDSFKYLWSKFKYVLLALLVVILFSIIFILEIKNPDQVESQEIYIGKITITNLSSWISIIAIPVTAIWAMYQFKKSVKIKQQEKATEIAKEFSKTIVHDLGIINNVYISSDLYGSILTKEKYVEKIEYFNTNEVRAIFKDDDYPTKYKEKRDKVYIKQLNYLYRLELYCMIEDCPADEKEKMINKIKNNKMNEEDLKKLDLYFEKKNDMPYRFLELEGNTLNKLEYLCMEISSKAASSDYIYQSLHQMFLRSIRILYLEISTINTKHVDKFYTNIIHVYNLWSKKYQKQRALEKRRIKKSNEDLNPKIETV